VLTFVLRRLAQGLAIMFGVTTLTFALVHAVPGEPFAAVLGEARMTPEIKEAWRAHYGLDRPLPVQFAVYVRNVARGDLGSSFVYQRSVAEVLRDYVPNTLLLMSVALVLSFAGGIGLGALQASRPGGWFDRLTNRVSLVIAALPDFWLATAVVFVFALHWRLAPPGGMTDVALHSMYTPIGRVMDTVRHLVLPAGTLALAMGAVVARYQRDALLEVLPHDYVRTARAKGVSERRVLYRHALRNAFLPTITLFGLALPALIGGAVFVETVFAWPGMGLLAVNAVTSFDYPLVLATTMLASAMVIVGGLVADLLYAVADPRLRHA
jgi:peptide/nickel transport system permease protein